MVGLPWETARGRGGDRRPHGEDPRHDDRRRPQPRPRRAHPPFGEPLRAQAGDALPVAAHGGPARRPTASCSSSARPSAGWPTWTPSARARARGVSQSILALADRRVADALEFACLQRRGPEARHEGGGPRSRLLPLPRPGPRRGPALGHRRQRRLQGLLPARAGQEPEGAPLAALPRDPGLHPLRRCASRRRTRRTACPRSGRRWGCRPGTSRPPSPLRRDPCFVP